ncbi:MAG: FAD-dependent oxidoreductase [Archangium gephyra]|uniref:FAD-dependent oxidoreductase n=1 Tax=Archangium gephyra TaxID=48 RepID=A0A2W5T932_9BACT|nr:MAG: FAD-dependent oxidoreductase [Archangium gephyra]
MRVEQAEVVVTGAGPSGSIAAGMLRQQGRQVLVLERETFPRFSIGESMLPQIMQYVEEAGMLRDVVEAGFQFKNGAVFTWGEERYTSFDFRDKFGDGWGTTYQVQRAKFDKVLADAASRMGADVRYRHEVTAVEVGASPALTVKNLETGEVFRVETKFILDASGFARLLPRLLDLEQPSNFPVRQAFFTHVEDRIGPKEGFDREKIRIVVHPKHVDVWFWLIPFSDGRCSLGVVAEAKFLDTIPGDEMQKLQTLANEDPGLHRLLKNANWDTPARTLRGYASNVKRLCGEGFALLGNAGEFLDPVFSSGVTIAMTSSSLATRALHRQLNGETVDWQKDYATPLKDGVDAFRAFVEAWYRGGFQNIIFHPTPDPEIRKKICAILAGYAWNKKNPFVAEPRRVSVLEQICAPS